MWRRHYGLSQQCQQKSNLWIGERNQTLSFFSIMNCILTFSRRLTRASTSEGKKTNQGRITTCFRLKLFHQSSQTGDRQQIQNICPRAWWVIVPEIDSQYRLRSRNVSLLMKTRFEPATIACLGKWVDHSTLLLSTPYTTTKKVRYS